MVQQLNNSIVGREIWKDPFIIIRNFILKRNLAELKEQHSNGKLKLEIAAGTEHKTTTYAQVC